MKSRKVTTDAIEILKHITGDDPEMQKLLEEVRMESLIEEIVYLFEAGESISVPLAELTKIVKGL